MFIATLKPFLWSFDLIPSHGLSLRGFAITLRHTALGRTPLGDWLSRRRDNTQHLLETDIHAVGGIRTRNPSKRAAADPLRPRGHQDRQNKSIWNRN